MTHKQLLIVALTFIHFTTVPMQMDVETEHNHWPTLPSDIFWQIIAATADPSLKPWQKFYKARKLAQVSTAWKSSLYKADDLNFIFNIPRMHYAAMTDDVDEIVKLKLRGESLHAQDQSSFSPIDYAAACNQRNALMILKIGTALERNEINPSISITNRKMLAIIESESLNKYSQQNLETAIEEENFVKILKIMSSDDIDSPPEEIYEENLKPFSLALFQLMRYSAQCKAETLLFSAIERERNPSTNKFYIFEKCNANPNAYDSTGSALIHYASSSNAFLPTLHKLLKIRGIDINRLHQFDRYNALQMSVKHNALICMNYLISKGANGYNVCRQGNTALHYAATTGHLECLQELLKTYKDLINSKNKYGYTPLMLTVQKTHKSSMLFLIEQKADLNIRSNTGNTALHYAVAGSKPNIELATLLLVNKPDINCICNENVCKRTSQESDGKYTPLHYAARNGNTKCVKLLLRYKADTTPKTQLGYTALDLAGQYEYPKIVQLLS